MNVKTRLLIFQLFLVLLLFSCNKKDTSWGSGWEFPVVNDTLAMDDYVNDSTIVANTSLNTYELDLTRTILDLGIEDLIDIPDTTIEQSYHLSTGNLTIPPGTSIVNQIEEHSFEFSGVQLKKVRVKTGTIQLIVYNPIETAAYFTVKLPGVTKNGVVFSQQYFTTAGSATQPSQTLASLDISGYEIDLTGIDGTSYNKIQSQLIVKTDPQGQSVTMNSQDVFSVKATFTGLVFDYARGYFGNLIVSDTASAHVDGLSNLLSGSVHLLDANVQLLIESGIKADAVATITEVKNTNSAYGTTVSLTGPGIGSPVYLSSATGSWNTLVDATQSITFSSSNSNIVPFLENLGGYAEVGYKIELNPWGNTSGGWNEVFPTSRLKVKMNASMPMSLTVDHLTLRDTFDFDVNQDGKKASIKSGSIILDAVNAFPFAAGVKLYMLDANGNLLHTIVANDLTAGTPVTYVVESALTGVLDTNDGLMKKQTQVVFTLPESVIQDLKKIKKIAVEAVLNSADASSSYSAQVSIPLGAFLKIKAKAKFEMQITY